MRTHGSLAFLVLATMLATPGASPVASLGGGSCTPHKAAHGFTCKCDATSCDAIAPLDMDSVPAGHFVIYTSSKGPSDSVGARLNRSVLAFDAKQLHEERTITFNSSETFQTIRGFGNAFTDAAAVNFNKMAPAVQKLLLEQYWGGGGMGLTVGRVPIASTDFSTHVYSYDDVPGDVELAHFSVEMDDSQKIPLIKSARSTLMNSMNLSLQLFASPWAPPAWMTSSNKTTDNPTLAGGPNGTIARVYARYLVKFFEEYEKRGLSFWALTAQNEPAGNTGAWQDLKFTAEQQRDFIKYALGPAMKASPATSQLDLLIMDDQRIHLPGWADTVLADPEAAQYVAGIGLHWYTATEDLLPPALYFGKMATTHKHHPSTYMFATEACEGFLPWSQGVYLGDWTRGETYAHDILGDLNNWSEGWTDWNAFLDMGGGPNWAKNVVDSPIILDTADGGIFHKQPMYYAMAHFAKFLVPGTVRIGVESRGSALHSAMECGAFRRPDGLVALVVLNRGLKLSSETAYSVRVGSGAWINLEVPAHSFQTILFRLPA